MGDNSFPPKNPQEGSNQAPPNDRAGGGATPNNKQIGTPSEINALDILNVIGGVILGFVGVALSDAGFHIWGFVCYFLAVSCGIFMLKHLLKKAKFPFLKSLFWLLIILNFVLFSFLSWHTVSRENPPPLKPIETARDGVVTMLPNVTLDIGPTIDPKDPFGTTFIIYNQSGPPIHDISGLAYWNDAGSQMKRTVFGRHVTSETPRLKPGMKLGLEFFGQTGFPAFGPRTFVNVEISYTADSFPYQTNRIFKFCVVQDTSGNFQWIPLGEGETLNDILARIKKQIPSSLADVFPILDVRVSGVENISYTNQEYPLKISYSWKNIGGEAATGVYIEWDVWDEQNGMILTWMNRWSDAYLKQVLWPGMTNGENRIYRDKTSPAICEGIISGKLKLIGSVFYKDLPTNGSFFWLIKAVRTNDEFETRTLGFYFKSENTNVPSFTMIETNVNIIPP